MEQRTLLSKEHHRCFSCGLIIPEGMKHIGVETPPFGELVYFCNEKCKSEMPQNRKVHRRKE